MSNKFWIGYILFFIFPFPMIFEYAPMIASGDFAHYVDASRAFIYLGLGFLLWIIACTSYYRAFLKPLHVSKNIRSIKKHGVSSVARIVSVKLNKQEKGIHYLELILRLKNLSGTIIQIPFNIEDARPELNRFNADSEIRMRIDPQLRNPYFLPEEGSSQPNTRLSNLLTGFFIFLIVFCFGYLIFSYWLQSHGHGWRFLHFWHPWVTIPMWGLFYGGLFKIIVRVIPGTDEMFGLMSARNIQYVFRGKKAIAEVLSANQTGTYINEQPEVRFELRYKDDQQITYTGEVKTIINLLQIHKVHQPTKAILYLPEDPQKIIFADAYLPDLPVELNPAILN